jgi:hypothetical protein
MLVQGVEVHRSHLLALASAEACTSQAAGTYAETAAVLGTARYPGLKVEGRRFVGVTGPCTVVSGANDDQQ